MRCEEFELEDCVISIERARRISNHIGVRRGNKDISSVEYVAHIENCCKHKKEFYNFLTRGKDRKIELKYKEIRRELEEFERGER